jgi:hypothetical protein
VEWDVKLAARHSARWLCLLNVIFTERNIVTNCTGIRNEMSFLLFDSEYFEH